ncbi:MAG: MATE family efflux transporter [Oscillospiraceae bacterium]|nr:MATE family efflux transporter [Oscillospiraceae bacterium]
MLNRYIGDKAFYRKLLTVMMPVLIQNIITGFVSVLDNVMVGQVGTEPMSGVAIVNQLIFIFNLSIFGGHAGAGIFTAQFYGKSDPEGIRYTVRAKLYIGLAAVVTAVSIFIGFGEQLISLFLHEGQENLDLAATLDFGLGYMDVMLFSLLPFALMQVYSSTLRECGETLIPMKASVTAVLTNLVGNYILIFGKFGAPAMGVEGAAIATVIARWAECFIVMFYAHRHHSRFSFVEGLYRSFRIPWALTKQIIITGSPLLINELLWSMGTTILNQCYSLRGLEVVSALNIATTVSNLFFCAFFAMGNTIAIIVGQLLGAGEIDRAVDEDRKLIAFSVAVSTLLGIALALLSSVIPEIYNTTDTVKAIAAKLLVVNAVFMPLHAYVHGSYFTLRSGGKTVITFIFDSGFMWVFSVTAAFALSRLTSIPIIPMFAIVEGLSIVKALFGWVLLRSRTWANKLV